MKWCEINSSQALENRKRAERKSTNLPQGVSLVRENLEVFLSESDWRQRLQAQVSPTLHKPHQWLKGVQAQPVIAVVWQVSHEYADLPMGERGRVRLEQESLHYTLIQRPGCIEFKSSTISS